MSFKCPDCGASLTDDSKFCKYCGAKIDDGVKRIEVKIDKRVEDVADLRRVEYEEKESELRQKRMKRDMRNEKARMMRARIFWIFVALLYLAAVLLFVTSGSDRQNMLGMRITGFALVGIATVMWANRVFK